MENLERLHGQFEKLLVSLNKTTESTEKSQGTLDKLDKKFSAITGTIDGLSRKLTNLSGIVAGALGGEAAINAVGKYGKSLFDVSKNLALVGQNMKDFEKAQASLQRQTQLSKADTVALFNEMSKMRGIKLTTEQFEKTGVALTKAFGPSLQDAVAGFRELEAVQKNYPFLLEKINRGMSEKAFTDFAASLRLSGKATDDQLDALTAYYDVVNKGGAVINAEGERFKKVSEVIQKLKTVGEDLLLRFGEPLAEMFTDIGEKIASMSKYVDELFGNDSFKTIIKLLAGAGAATGAVAGIAGIGGGLKDILGFGRGSRNNPMFTKEVDGSPGGGGLLERLFKGGSSAAGGAGGGAAAGGAGTAIGGGLLASIGKVAAVAGPLAVIAAGIATIGYTLNKSYQADVAMDESEKSIRDSNKVYARGEELKRQGGQAFADPQLEKDLKMAMMKQSLFAMQNRDAIAAGNKDLRNQLDELAKSSMIARERRDTALNGGTVTGTLADAVGGGRDGTSASMLENKKNLEIIANLYSKIINPSLDMENDYLLQAVDSAAKYSGNVKEVSQLTGQYISNLKTQLDGVKTLQKFNEDDVKANEKKLKDIMAAKGITGDINTLRREAIKNGGEEAKIAADLLATQQGMIPLRQKELEITNKMRDAAYELPMKALNSQIDLNEKSIALDEARLKLNETMLGPLGANFELRSQMFDKISATLAINLKNKKILEESYKTANEKERLEIQKKLLENDMQRVGLVQRQVDLTKSLRDGYLDALGSFNNVEGAFSKLIMTRENGIGQAMREFKAAQGLTAGAIGAGGTNPFLKWGADGSLKMDSAQDAYNRASGYQKGYDTMVPSIFKDFGVGVNPLQNNAMMGGPNTSPMAGVTGSAMSSSTASEPHIVLLGKIADNTGKSTDLLAGKGSITGSATAITGNSSATMMGMDDTAIRSAAIKQATKEIEGEKAQAIQRALSSGGKIPNFDDKALDAKRNTRMNEIMEQMKTQLQNEAGNTGPTGPLKLGEGSGRTGYDSRPEVDTLRGGSGGQKGPVTLTFNIKGDNVETIVADVNKVLGQQLTNMVASGGTGRMYELSNS